MSGNAHLALFLEPVLAARWLDAYPIDTPLVFNGREYLAGGVDSIFYEFMFDKHGAVTGVQIFPGTDAPIGSILEDPEKVPYVQSKSGVATIWLSDDRSGRSRPLQAFALDYLVADVSRWALLFSIEMWLTPEEAATIRSLPLHWV